jgi:hypothetical protein
MLVTSANKLVKGFALTFEHLMIYGRSLIYSRKSKGPRIDAWGTPCLICPQSYSLLSKGPFSVFTL